MVDHDWEILLDRYLAGECSPAEEAVVREELARRGEVPGVIEALRQVRARTGEGAVERRASSGEAVPQSAVTEALARLDRRLVDAGLRPAPAPRLQLRLERSAPERRRWFASAGVRRAAMVAGVLLTSAAAWWLITQTASTPGASARTAMREFVTPPGQRVVFRLIDGTEVMLGVDSRLRVPADYAVARRDLELEGEAYFTVVHDSTRPFVVHTAYGITRDIGTRFVVRAYRDEPSERVIVAEGAVAVTGRAARGEALGEQLLHAAQGAEITPNGAVTVANSIDIDQELAWTRGELRFANTPLGVAVLRLNRWYDIDVQLADSVLAGRPVSGAYAGESLDQVLTLITAAVGARFERHDKRVVMFTMPEGARP